MFETKLKLSYRPINYECIRSKLVEQIKYLLLTHNCIIDSRVKTIISMLTKTKCRMIPFSLIGDIIGIRIICQFTAQIKLLANILSNTDNLNILKHNSIRERDKVIYIYGMYNSIIRYEIQLYPIMIYYGLSVEHDKYKDGQNGDNILRNNEHLIQDYLDDFYTTHPKNII